MTFTFSNGNNETDGYAGPAETRPHEANQKKQSAPQAPAKFTKKENGMLAQRIQILDWYHGEGGKNQQKTAEHFDKIYPNLKLKQPRVSKWVKDKAKWREEWAKCSGKSSRTTKRAQQTQHHEVTEMMDLWVSKAMGDHILLTGEVLHQKWTQFVDLVGVPEDERLKLSEGWLGRYKGRLGLKQQKCYGKAGSADTVVFQS